MTEVGDNAWRGNIVPLDNRFTLYLKIYRDPQGALVGAFRNPEYNFNGGFPLFSVTHDGDKLRFTAKKEDAGREIAIDAHMLHGPDRVEVSWPILKHPLQLVRAKPEEARDFFPRPLGSAPYVYRMPEQTNDGWTTAPASSVGFDEAALAATVQKIIEVDPASRRAWLIHSLAVIRHGKLVLDEYFYGADRDRPHDLRSAGKTYASVMLGAVMLQGVKLSPESKAYDVLAPLGPFANPDPRKAKITLGHLMTHSAGFACDDNDDNSPGNEDHMQSQSEQPNWWKYTLDLPMAFEPGAHYAYCSANINLVGAALTTATHTWLPELFDRTVAEPLQFGTYYWNLIPTNEGYLGGGAYVRPRDFAKMGQTYLAGGVWNGRRIASEAWTREAMAPHMRISPATTGRSGEDFTNVYWETDDGYTWHMMDVKSGDKRYHAIFANGNGGQLLVIVPQFDLVVAFTAGNYGQGLWNRERDDIVGGLIIPAIRN
jgi:CubicO group peptidase (beta-lactamase class C family)